MSVYDYLKTTDFITLRNLMLSTVPSDIDTSEGSFMYNALSPTALFVSSMYDMMRMILDESSLETATGSNLENICTTKPRVYRRAGTCEKIRATFTPSLNTSPTIPTSTVFTMEDGTEFAFRGDVNSPVDGYTLWLVSSTSGAKSSYIGAELEPSPAIANVESIVVSSVDAAGMEEETDDEYRFRAWRTYSQPFSGSCSDYLRKIFSDFPSSPSGFYVDNALVLSRGGFSGSIYIIPAKINTPYHLTTGEIQALEEYFDKKVDGIGGYGTSIAPIGHVVRVFDFTDFFMDFDVDIVVKSGTSFTKLEEAYSIIRGATTDYLKEIINESWPSTTSYNERISRNSVYAIYYYVNTHEYKIMMAIKSKADSDSDYSVIKAITIHNPNNLEADHPQNDVVIHSGDAKGVLPIVRNMGITVVQE